MDAKRSKIAIVAALVCSLALFAALLAGCSSDSESKKYQLVSDGKLTVATSLNFPPFEYLSDGESAGYSIEVMREVASRLGLSCEFVNVPFESVVSSIEAGRQYDAAISSLSIYAQREEQVDFTSTYYLADQAVVTLKDEYLRVEELQGKTVSAQAGTMSETYAEDAVSEKVVPHEDVASCFSALRKGKTQAIVVDAAVARYMIENGYSDCEILETVATGEQYGIALNKDNRALTDAINEVLAEMEEDGTLEALQDQYFN